MKSSYPLIPLAILCLLLFQSSVLPVHSRPLSSEAYRVHNPFPQILPHMSAGRNIFISHNDSATGSVLVKDIYSQPPAGSQVYSLPGNEAGIPNQVSNVKVIIDGAGLPFSFVETPDFPGKRIVVVIPANAQELEISYDMVDGALPYQDIWYIFWEGSVPQHPDSVTISLPAGSSQISYNNEDIAQLIDTNTIRFTAPDFRRLHIKYKTGSVPNLYYTVVSEHFSVGLPKVYAGFEPLLVIDLEFMYRRNAHYLGYDLNTYLNHDSFSYSFPPQGYFTVNTAGWCVHGGPCAVAAHNLSLLNLPLKTWRWTPYGLIAHELAHGWQGILVYGSAPWWINTTEGFANLLSIWTVLDLGQEDWAQLLYAAAYRDYEEYLSNPNLEQRDSANIVIASSLTNHFGWIWMQKFVSALISGELALSGTEQQRSDLTIVFLSEKFGQNLVPFFDLSQVNASPWVHTRLQNLPVTQATIIEQLPQPAGEVGFDRDEIIFYLDPDYAKSGVINAAVLNRGRGMLEWEVHISPVAEWLSLEVSSGNAAPTRPYHLPIYFDAANLPEGSYQTTLEFSVLENSMLPPVIVPVTLHIGPFNAIFLPAIIR
jgi:hypothetical protein